MIKLIKDGQVITEEQFKDLYPNTSFPVPIPFSDYGYSVIFPKPVPEYNKLTQTVIQGLPVLNTLDKYEESWQIVDLTEEEVTVNTALNNQKIQEDIATNIGKLWQAAHDYEYARINGMAIGMLTLGVIANKPKSLAVKSWTQNLWDLYYSRKPLVTNVMDPTLLDFSVVGEIPHSISELIQEILN